MRARLRGTAERPRAVVFRSNRHIYAQLVNDDEGRILASVSDGEVKMKESGVEVSKAVGKLLAKKAKEQQVSAIVFDRAGYKYHGNVKAVADGMREEGLVF